MTTRNEKHTFPSLGAQLVKDLPALWETWVPSLGWEDSPGEGKGYQLQYSGLGKSMDWLVHGVAETEGLSLSVLPKTGTSPSPHRLINICPSLGVTLSYFLFVPPSAMQHDHHPLHQKTLCGHIPVCILSLPPLSIFSVTTLILATVTLWTTIAVSSSACLLPRMPCWVTLLHNRVIFGKCKPDHIVPKLKPSKDSPLHLEWNPKFSPRPPPIFFLKASLTQSTHFILLF